MLLNEVISLPYYDCVEEKISATLLASGSDRMKVVDRRQVFLFMSSDDKAKTPIGEPFRPISTGFRAKTGNLVSASEVQDSTSTLDHDFSKASLIPTVDLDLNIPSQRKASCFDG